LAFSYVEEDPNHVSRIILKSDGELYNLQLQRKIERSPNEPVIEIKLLDDLFYCNLVESRLIQKAVLTMQLSEINSKLWPEFNIEEYFRGYECDTYSKLKRKRDLKREQELLREMYSTLESEEDFARRKNMSVTTIRSMRQRYNLPSRSAFVRAASKAMRVLEFGKKNYLCKHKDCIQCRLIERRLS